MQEITHNIFIETGYLGLLRRTKRRVRESVDPEAR